MPDVVLPPGQMMIPIANHFFTPDKLKAAAEAALAEHKDAKNVLKGTVDAAGAQVVLVMSSQSGQWAFQTAFAKKWDGSVAFGAAGSIAW